MKPDPAQLASMSSIAMVEKILDQFTKSPFFDMKSEKTTSQEQYIRELEKQIRENYRDYY